MKGSVEVLNFLGLSGFGLRDGKILEICSPPQLETTLVSTKLVNSGTWFLLKFMVCAYFPLRRKL